jgi:Putative peptidoglycan binding domain
VNRKTWVLAATAVLIAVASIGGVAVTSGTNRAAAVAAQAPQVSTAQVQRRTLWATVPQDGTLTYQAQADGSPYSVINQGRGTYTALPALGQVIQQGHTLYRVNDSPVALLYGQTPAYRTLSAGASGPDVAELNADLVALGYATSAQLSPASGSFGSASTAAVEKLQAALGMTQSGTLTLGQAVFDPTAVRVTSVSAALGGGAQPGQTVLQGTSTTRQVQVALDASQQIDVAVGDTVSITLPNNQATPGVVSSVGTVATCPSGSGGSSSSPAAPGTDTCSSNSSASSPPTINVDVTPSDPTATRRWDQAPVQVGITTASVRDALVVPVTALLAQSTGGYAVEVVGTGRTEHLEPVSLGLFDDANGLVAVTGPHLAAGQKVTVPGT